MLLLLNTAYIQRSLEVIWRHSSLIFTQLDLECHAEAMLRAHLVVPTNNVRILRTVCADYSFRSLWYCAYSSSLAVNVSYCPTLQRVSQHSPNKVPTIFGKFTHKPIAEFNGGEMPLVHPLSFLTLYLQKGVGCYYRSVLNTIETNKVMHIETCTTIDRCPTN